VLIVVVIDGKFADSEWLLSLMGLYQTDCNKIVESKMNLDRSLQPLSERGSEPSDRKQTPVSHQICRSCEGDKRGSDRAPPGEARQEASSENRESGL
jgi:hypothetical protein